MEERKIFKNGSGYTDRGSLLACTMYWDEFGTYIGQEQMNCMDDDPDVPPVLFFKAQGNEEPVKYALTKEQMETAI